MITTADGLAIRQEKPAAPFRDFIFSFLLRRKNPLFPHRPLKMAVASFVQHVQDAGTPIGANNNPAQFNIKDTALLEKLKIAIKAGKRVTAKLSMIIMPSKFSLGDQTAIVNVDTSWDHNAVTLRNGVRINSLGYIDLAAVANYNKLKTDDSVLVIPFGLSGQPGVWLEFSLDGVSDMKSFNITLNIGPNNFPIVFANKHKEISAHFIISIYG